MFVDLIRYWHLFRYFLTHYSFRYSLKKCLLIYFTIVILYELIEIIWINVELLNGTSNDYRYPQPVEHAGALPPCAHSANNCAINVAYHDNCIDAVYTWVNGSDPQLINSVTNITNEILLKQLRTTCHTFPKCTNQTNSTSNCALLPAILIRPILVEPRRHFSNILKYENFNQSASLIYFQNLSIARQQSLDCARIFDGKIYKLTSLFIGNNSNHSEALEGISLIKLDNINVKHQFAQSDPLKYFSSLTRKNFQLLKVNNLWDDSLLYTSKFGDANVSKMMPLINSKLAGTINYQFNVTHPISFYTTDSQFFHHQLENENIRKNRFADNDELKYSLRSLQKNAPWIRNIYIVTNGQIPRWLNLQNHKIKIVKHKDIFLNESHLPSFSSSAIESHIHRIKNLSKRFLYFNDDIILGRPIYPEDFYTDSKGFKIYLSWPVPNCVEGCPLNWLNDGYCDKACNLPQCLWDGGDCLNRTTDHSTNVADASKVLRHTVQSENYCSINCLNNWLGDSFCDHACNTRKCGYDMADCGVEHFDQFNAIEMSPTQNQYAYSQNDSLIYLNFTDFFIYKRNRMNQYKIEITDASYDNVTCVRSAVFNLQHNILAILFYENRRKDDLNFYVNASLNHHLFNVNISVNIGINNKTKFQQNNFNLTKLIENKLQLDTKEIKPVENKIPQILTINEQLLIPCNLTLNQLPDLLREKFEQIDRQFESGLLTDSGKQYFYQQLKMLYSELICNATQWKENGNQQNPITNFVEYYLLKSNQLRFSSRRLLDSYADSLVYVNHLYNKQFGIEVRKAPAHMAHFIDQEIMNRLQNRFREYFNKTSSHQIRSGEDMQFAFSYFYYLMSEFETSNIMKVMRQWDIDNSSDLTMNELKTLIIQLYDSPLKTSDSKQFYIQLNNCCNNCIPLENGTDRIMLNANEKSKFRLPTTIISECEPLKERLLTKFSKNNANKFEIVNDNDVEFKMLRSNQTLLELELNKLRKNPKKFICLNDNFDHNQNISEDIMLRQILNEFYMSMFPLRSQYELIDGQQNEFLNIDHYNGWNHPKSSQNANENLIHINFSYLFITINIILLLLVLF